MWVSSQRVNSIHSLTHLPMVAFRRQKDCQVGTALSEYSSEALSLELGI